MRKSIIAAALLAAMAQSQRKPQLTRCAAARDGDCSHAECPQIRDGEPQKSGRHCPLDIHQGESDD